jgi:hypothetical protein
MAFALAHVYFQKYHSLSSSNSAGFSPIPCFQHAKKEGTIRLSCMRATVFGFIGAALSRSHCLKRIDSDVAHQQVLQHLSRVGVGNLPAGGEEWATRQESADAKALIDRKFCAM